MNYKKIGVFVSFLVVFTGCEVKIERNDMTNAKITAACVKHNGVYGMSANKSYVICNDGYYADWIGLSGPEVLAELNKIQKENAMKGKQNGTTN